MRRRSSRGRRGRPSRRSYGKKRRRSSYSKSYYISRGGIRL